MTYNISDEKLNNNQAFQDFLKDNPSTGTLKVRVSSINKALPVENVNITVSKVIGDDTVIFFDGKTDESGMVMNIKLPTPMGNPNDEVAPSFTTYQLHAVYEAEKFDKIYDIALCCGVSVIQNINITPEVDIEMRNFYGN